MSATLSDYALVTLTTFQEIVNDDSDEGELDDRRTRLINACSRAMEKHTRRLLASRQYTRVSPANDTEGRSVILVPEWPVVSVSEVRYGDSDLTTFTTFDASDYVAEGGRRIRVLDGTALPDPYRVQTSYVGGYGWDAGTEAHDPDLVDDDLQLACALWAKYMDKKIDKGMHVAENQGIETLTRTAMFRKMPVEVQQLLDPFMRKF